VDIFAVQSGQTGESDYHCDQRTNQTDPDLNNINKIVILIDRNFKKTNGVNYHVFVQLVERGESELISDSLPSDKVPTCDNPVLVLAARNPFA